MSTDDHGPQRPDDVEARLRRSLREGRPEVDADSFLADVHRGARGRQRRRVAGGVAATAAVLAVAAYGVSTTGIFESETTTAADNDRTPTVTTHGPATDVSTAPTASTSASPTQVPARRALSLSATDTDHQYLLTAGKFGCGGDCLAAYTTDDAGQTFTKAAPLGVLPSDPDPTTKTAYAIRFADPDNGWVYGGGLRSTHDGGRSWSTPTLPADGIVTTLEAWGDRVYAGVYDDPTGRATIVRSSAGSDAWQPVDVSTPIGTVFAMALSQSVTAILASPPQATDFSELIVSTDDATWSTVQPCGKRARPSSVSTSASSLWITCTSDRTLLSAGGGRAFASVSTDAGQGWTRVAGDFSPGSQVQARDDRTALVLDAHQTGLTIVTVDGQPQHTLSNAGNLLTIGFTNPTTGYVRTMAGGILRTVDSGATWQPYPLP